MDKILDKAIEFLYDNEDEMDEEKAEIIRYGLEILLIKITFFSAALVISSLMHSFWECIIFTALFSRIRSYAGGYHADTRRKCFVLSMLTFCSVFIILKLIKIFPVILIIIAILAAASSVVIFRFAPIDTENKRLDDEEIQIFKKKLRTAVIVELIVAAAAYFLNFKGIMCSVMLSIILAALLICIEIKNNRIKTEEL